MKIKYIKENFFDDNDIDNLSAEETVAQEQADLIFNKFTDIFPDILAKTALRSTVYGNKSCCIYFPVPHEMPYKTRSPYHKIRIIDIDLVETERLALMTRANNGVYKSPSSYDELKVSASYNAKTNDLTVNLDWLPESMTRTLLVRVNTPVLGNYSYNALVSTAYTLNNFTSAIRESLVNAKFKININTLTINILVNSKFLIKLSDTGDGSSVYNDYFNFVTAVTGRTLEEFETASRKCKDNAFSKSFKKSELEYILPKSTFKPDPKIRTDIYYSYYQTN